MQLLWLEHALMVYMCMHEFYTCAEAWHAGASIDTEKSVHILLSDYLSLRNLIWGLIFTCMSLSMIHHWKPLVRMVLTMVLFFLLKIFSWHFKSLNVNIIWCMPYFNVNILSFFLFPANVLLFHMLQKSVLSSQPSTPEPTQVPKLTIHVGSNSMLLCGHL